MARLPPFPHLHLESGGGAPQSISRGEVVTIGRHTFSHVFSTNRSAPRRRRNGHWTESQQNGCRQPFRLLVDKSGEHSVCEVFLMYL